MKTEPEEPDTSVEAAAIRTLGELRDQFRVWAEKLTLDIQPATVLVLRQDGESEA